MELHNQGISPRVDDARPCRDHLNDKFKSLLGNKFHPMEDGVVHIKIKLLCSNWELYEISIDTSLDGLYYVDRPDEGDCICPFEYLIYRKQQSQPQQQKRLPLNLRVRAPIRLNYHLATIVITSILELL
jgi:hypothetical protein